MTEQCAESGQVTVAWGANEWVVGPDFAAIGALAEAMSGAIADVGNIAKAGRNEFDRYTYATASDVDTAIGGAMSKHGLSFAMSVESVMQEPRQMKSSMATYNQVMYRWAILHKSGAVLSGRWASEAVDPGLGDKGLNKCATAAGKYLKLRLFVAATTDEVDSDAESGEREAQGRTQWQGTTEGAVRQGQEETVAVGISNEGVPAKLAEFRGKFLATINPQFTRPASEKQQGLAVSCLEALFPGKGEEQRTNTRYDLSRFMVGKASSKDYTSGEASAFIEWAIIGKDEATGKTDYTPRLHAQQAAERVVNWLAEQKGQTKMAVETEAGLPY